MIGPMMIFAAMLVQVPAAPTGSASGAMSVGATVVREPPPASIAIGRGGATIRNARGVTVSAEGGNVRRAAGGIVTVTPQGGRTIITLTY